MSTRKALFVLACLLLSAGIVVGMLPHSINDHDPVGVIGCGSAFGPSGDPAAYDLGAHAAGATFTNYEGECAAALSTPRTWGFVLMGIGIVGLLFLGLTRPKSQPSPRPADVTAES